MGFKDVVKSNQVSSASGGASAPSGDAISAAAKKLSDASYPFLKGIDWNSDLYIKPLPGVTAQKALKAVDKTILMGAAMDGNALKAGAEAHHKAIGSIDGSGVTSASDYEAVNNAVGHMVASVPTSKVMDVYNAWAGILSPSVPNKLFSGVNPLDANAAQGVLRVQGCRQGGAALNAFCLHVAGSFMKRAGCLTEVSSAHFGRRCRVHHLR